MSPQRYLTVSIAAIIVCSPIPLPLVLFAVIATAIVGIPVLLPRSYVVDILINGLGSTLPVLLVDMTLFRIGGEFCLLLIAVVVLLVLLWRVVETLCRVARTISVQRLLRLGVAMRRTVVQAVP
jgi:hypothetical protein